MGKATWDYPDFGAWRFLYVRVGRVLGRVFLNRLENNLQKITGSKIETINAGVPGWNLNHYYVYLKEIGRSLFTRCHCAVLFHQ